MSLNRFESECRDYLGKREREFLRRSTKEGMGIPKCNLSTNSYLGMERDDEVNDEALKLSHNRLSGSTASRLVYSEKDLYQMLEKELSDLKGSEASLVFNSGYTANTGILQATASRKSEVFSDRLNHASIIDGIRLSQAKTRRYRHCDTNHLESLLKKSKADKRIIVTDTVFSMDGDIAPLRDICALAERYSCILMLDEAHATGIFGEKGGGLAQKYNLSQRVDISIGTLSKAAAGLGGFFSGSSVLREFYVNTARSLIYSTALPDSVLAFNLASIRKIKRDREPAKKLLNKAKWFREYLQKKGFDTGNSETQIVPCIIPDQKRLLKISETLTNEGFFVPAIRPPTVPENTSRLRFSLRSDTRTEDLKRATDIVEGEW